MEIKKIFLRFSVSILLLSGTLRSIGHEIYFCGERIPVNDQFVATKLMDIIKKQINYGFVAQLRQKGNPDMTMIELYLRETGLPEDFKYLPIVESGFRNVVSSAGAAGVWQLMRGTAIGLGLTVTDYNDDRNDLRKATNAACQVLAQCYQNIRKQYGISSWVLTAAAYNIGIGKIRQAIRQQGNNYFEMNLNKETAEYVYKIIAVKELFEYPELYMKNFGYNVFSTTAASRNIQQSETDKPDKTNLPELQLKVDESDGNHPDRVAKNAESKKNTKTEKNTDILKESYIWAHISGNYQNIKDSAEITVVLDGDLSIENDIINSGNTITGRGWIIDGKVFIDFGYGSKLVLIDIDNKKHDGVLLSALTDENKILLRKTVYRQ